MKNHWLGWVRMATTKTSKEIKMSATIQPGQPIVVHGWTWRLNEDQSELAASVATDTAQLIRMADDILDGLMNFTGYSWPPNTLMYLIRNPNLPLEKACLLRKRTNDTQCLLALVRRKDATAELLDECADEVCQAVVHAIVHHENVIPETVAKIARNPDVCVVEVALSSSRLPDETLESFVTSEVPEFRQNVALKSKNPETLAKLAFDPVDWIRGIAVFRDITGIEVLERVATTDDNIEVVIEATKRLTNPDVLKVVFEQLGKWPASAQVQQLKDALIANPHTSELVRVVIQI